MIKLTKLEQEIKAGFDAARMDVLTHVNHYDPAWLELNDGMRRALLTAPDGNVKLAKGTVPSWSLNLAPANSSGRNVCPRSTPQCRANCLVTAGRFAMGNTPAIARQRRTSLLINNPAAFCRQLCHEIRLAKRSVVNEDGRYMPYTAAVRLNGLSDIRWELVAPWLFEMFWDVQYYDYSKWSPAERQPPSNYDLTYSIAERHTDENVAEMIAAGHRVAMVAAMDSPWRNHTAAIDGDAHDMRFENPTGTIVVLKPKGQARRLAVGGFVR